MHSLDNGWCDKDHVLLHACFQLLTDFVEQEMRVYDPIAGKPGMKAGMQRRSSGSCIEGAGV